MSNRSTDRCLSLQALCLLTALPLSVLADETPVERTGKQVYRTACVECHASGSYGAPRFRNKADWAPRIAKGVDALHYSALNGHEIMPAKNEAKGAFSDNEIRNAVDYMVKQAR